MASASERTAHYYQERGKPVPKDQSLVGKHVRWREDHFEYTAEVVWHGDNGYVLKYTEVTLLDDAPVNWVGGKTPTATTWTVLD